MKSMDKENSSMPDTVEPEQSQGPVDPFHDVEGCKPFYQHSFGYVLFPEIKIKIGLSHKSVGDVFIRNRAGEFEFGGTCTMKEVKLGVFSKLSGQVSYGMIIFFATKRDYKNFVAGHNGPKKKHEQETQKQVTEGTPHLARIYTPGPRPPILYTER